RKRTRTLSFAALGERQMGSRSKLGDWENPDSVVRSEDWQEAIRKGCEMVQLASERKVRDLERRLDHLKTEAETLRRKGEELRTIHLSLESDLKESKNQNKAQMESNKKLAQEVYAMRADMSKLGQFRASLDQAVSFVEKK
ncbi:Serine/threonine-protein kinase 16, partial [Durusdinium trenchii]